MRAGGRNGGNNDMARLAGIPLKIITYELITNTG